MSQHRECPDCRATMHHCEPFRRDDKTGAKLGGCPANGFHHAKGNNWLCLWCSKVIPIGEGE